MQRDVIVKGRSLGGTSDLTLLATIKPGFVESLESVTYKTRVKRVLETLHSARMAAHEHATARLLSDAVERVGAIHSVRVAVVEPEDKVLLVVTFDGSWESYIRVLWDKVGTLLDLIFCSTVDYVTAHDHTFDEWLEWAQRVQIETGFFYGPADSTARDVLYHRRIERMRQRGLGTEVNELRAVLPSAEDAVALTTRVVDAPAADDPPTPVGDLDAARLRMIRERLQNGFQALAGLYRLTELFRPATPDGDVLRYAATSLLLEFVEMYRDGLGKDEFDDAHDEFGEHGGIPGRFARQLDWLFPGGAIAELGRPVPPYEPVTQAIRQDVQGGILQSYDAVTHGLVLMLSFDRPAAAHGLLEYLHQKITSADDSHDGVGGQVFRNLAFTAAGLRACGVGEDELELFPADFRQGMAARAGTLGDVRSNHPRRWRLPLRFTGLDSEPGEDAIELTAVHAVLQLRCRSDHAGVDYWQPNHPLRGEIETLDQEKIPGLRILAVQSLKRNYRDNNGKPAIVEHFGYMDGNAQPVVDQGAPDWERAHLGEILLGYNNSGGQAVDISAPGAPELTKARRAWLANGSFLVMRKYRQFVQRLSDAVAAAARTMARETKRKEEACAEEIYAKLMGRYRQDAAPLAALKPPGGINDFDFNKDPRGMLCPLHAHIRRANPRQAPGRESRMPRLMRRSMSYGPPADGGEADRGLLFMAYNTSFGEQFEVIQRWLAGGNSTGSSSGTSCPILGVSENGFPRHYSFEYQGADGQPRVLNIELEKQAPLFDEPETITRLEWGLYLFTPSIAVLERLAQTAALAGEKGRAAALPWKVGRGRELIVSLRRTEQNEGADAAIAAWKVAIEDPESIDRLDSAALWAAIREDHGGVLRTPYGVLVAGRELLCQVYQDKDRRYSVSGQMERMTKSIGPVSLGKDAGEEYDQESGAINAAILGLDPQPVFELCRGAANKKICQILAQANEKACWVGNKHYEVGFEAREVVDEVLATLCEHWFGIQEGGFFRRGSTDWHWKTGDKPLYPGHFTALSRYMFQPHPGPVPAELGESYGQALTQAMLLFVENHRKAGTRPTGPTCEPAVIALAAFDHPLSQHDNAFAARNMVGVLMGFTPTIIGAVLNVLREWQRDDSFWSLRAAVAAQPIEGFRDAYDLLHAPMAAASQMRPMPQIGWRTARVAHRLGAPGPNAVDIVPGDRIVLAMVSGTQQSLADGQPDGRLMFGGIREGASHPTHACPGYHAGIAAMLGTLASLLGRTEALRPGVAPLTFQVKEPVKCEAAVTSTVPESLRPKLQLFQESGETALGSTVLRSTVLVESASAGELVLAWGDSWLDQATDMADELANLGYVVNEGLRQGDVFCNYEKWLLLEKMRDDVVKVDADGKPDSRFLKYLGEKIGSQPKAILLSGGGNDSVGNVLFDLLNPKSPGVPIIDESRLQAHIAKLQGHLETIVDAIQAKLAAAGLNLPIIVHGYDYPIPFRGGAYPLNLPHWLRNPFIKRRYTDGSRDVDLEIAIPAMRKLIDALNDMLTKELTKGRPFVRYTNLRNTIAPQWDDLGKNGWRDNMHPTGPGFALLAAKIAAAI